MCNQMHIAPGIIVSGDNMEEIHMEWGERPTFLMTEVLHRPWLIKSLSSAVSYTQSHDLDAQCRNNKPQDPSYCIWT